MSYEGLLLKCSPTQAQWQGASDKRTRLAYAQGGQLAELKLTVSHGDWLPTLAKVDITERMAQHWMRIAAELTLEQVQVAGGMTAARGLLTEPKSELSSDLPADEEEPYEPADTWEEVADQVGTPLPTPTDNLSVQTDKLFAGTPLPAPAAPMPEEPAPASLQEMWDEVGDTVTENMNEAARHEAATNAPPTRAPKDLLIASLEKQLEEQIERNDTLESRLRELEAVAAPETAVQLQESNSLREQLRVATGRINALAEQLRIKTNRVNQLERIHKGTQADAG